MTKALPPIYRDCRRLQVHTEQVVRRFSRYHKYTQGTELRQQAMQLMRTVHYAVFDKAQQASHLQRMVWLVDDYKLSLQLGMDVGAFTLASPKQGRAGAAAGNVPQKTCEGSCFAAFETAAVLAADIGKQCGSWQQSVAKSAQSVKTSTSSVRSVIFGF